MRAFSELLRRVCVPICAVCVLSAALPARAENSDASAASLLPIALSVAAPVALLSATTRLSVVAVEVSADGTTWVLERASDGARASVRFAGKGSVAVGTVVTVTTLGAGLVLSAAGQAIAFVPNAVGRALFHDERITR